MADQAPAAQAAPAAPVVAAAPAAKPAAAAPAAAAPAAAPAAAAPAAAAPALVVVDPAAAREWLKANVEDPDGKIAGKTDAEVVELHRVGSKIAEKNKPVAKAPDAYADFITPEGVNIDKAVAESVKKVAKEFDLSQADAQKLINEVGPLVVKGEAARLAAFATQRADKWRADALADPEIGGTPEVAGANLATAMKTFEAFGTPALKDVLNKTGFGDNPEILRWAFRVGKQIGPDGKFVAGSGANTNINAPLEERAVSKLWPTK